MHDPGTSLDFSPATRPAEDLTLAWIHGSRSPRHPTDPPLQVHAYNSHTFILRESKDLSYDAPFLYLFFGNDRAILVDTGATADPTRFPLRATVDRLVTGWLAEHPRPSYELVVAHTHSHRDHTTGDPQFADRPRTRLVAPSTEAVRDFFGFGSDLDEVREFDLGGRPLELIRIPGHHPASIALYDRWTGWLLTGDTVYPGRLYVFDGPAYRASLDRLVRFASTRSVTYLLGGHVEMTRRAGRDYPFGARYQPRERPLPMTRERLIAVRDAAVSVADLRGAHAFEDFVVFNLPSSGAVLGQVLRGKLWNLRWRLGLA
jgi:hydroxyacylglutathione hydrolase